MENNLTAKTKFEKRVDRYMQCEKRTLAEMLALMDEKLNEDEGIRTKPITVNDESTFGRPYIEPNTTPSITPKGPWDDWKITCSANINGEGKTPVTYKSPKK